MKYTVSDSSLTSVADAIRTKGGTSASLSFPDGFVSAIQNIPSGGEDFPVFTITWNSGGSYTITCNKTYSECLTCWNDSDYRAAILTIYSDSREIWLGAYAYNYSSQDSTIYYGTETSGDPVADYIITYTSAGNITYAQSGISSRTSSDMTANNLTVTAPAGYYENNATKTLTDNNLVAGNIKKDVSIFGVTGSYEGSGGGSTLITKSITANGTYSAEDDSADGYSSVTVAVAGPPYVTGTFTGSTTEKGGIKTLSISYSGNGYPISLQIFPTAGSYKSGTTIYTSTQKMAMIVYSMTKDDTGTAPDWGNDAEKNRGVVFALYKNSDSDGTVITTSMKKDTRVFTTQNPVGSYSVNAVKFYDKNTMKIWIANTGEYGFLPEVEYTYQIVYSS